MVLSLGISLFRYIFRPYVFCLRYSLLIYVCLHLCSVLFLYVFLYVCIY